MNPVEVDPARIREAPVDSKGRVSVGTDYAGEKVRVAVIEKVDPDPRIDPPTSCEECGDTLGARFTVKDGEALCLPCGGVEPADGPDRVTVCEDCGEMWTGLTTYCDDCGSEKIRQEEAREQAESERSA